MPRTGAVPSSSFDHGVGRNNGINGAQNVTGKTQPTSSKTSDKGVLKAVVHNPSALTTESPNAEPANAQTVETLLALSKYISLSAGGFGVGLNLLTHPRFIELQQKTGLTLSDIVTSALKMVYFKDEQEILGILKIFDAHNSGILPSQIFSLISQKDVPDSQTWNAFLEWLEPGEKLNQRLDKLKALAHEWLGEGQDIDNMIQSTIQETKIGTWKCFGQVLKQAISTSKEASVDNLHLYLDKLNTAGEYQLLGECILEAVNKGLITEKEKLESYLTELATRSTEEAKPDTDASKMLGVQTKESSDIPISKEGKNYFPILCHYIRVIADSNSVDYEVRPDVNKLFENVTSPKSYSELLSKLIDSNGITEDEFDVHFKRLKQICFESQKPESGINEEAVFDRNGLNMKHSNMLLELETKAHGAGLVTAKPDIDYHLEFNKTNKNGHAVYEIVTNALTNGVITEQGRFDRILETYQAEINKKGQGFLNAALNVAAALGIPHNNYTELVMLAKKQNVIQDVMPYFEKLPEDSRFTFLQRGVKEKYITDLALVDSYIHKLETAGKGNSAAMLLFASLEAGIHKLDRGSFDELLATASRNNVPITFALAVENSKHQLGLTEEEARGYYDCARTVFPAVREKNAKAERED